MNTPVAVFISAFFLSAFAGVASVLRSDTKISLLRILAAVTNSGLLGLGIALIWYNRFQDNLFFLVGICLMAGLGGTPFVDLALALFRKAATTFAEKEEKK